MYGQINRVFVLISEQFVLVFLFSRSFVLVFVHLACRHSPPSIYHKVIVFSAAHIRPTHTTHGRIYETLIFSPAIIFDFRFIFYMRVPQQRFVYFLQIFFFPFIFLLVFSSCRRSGLAECRNWSFIITWKCFICAIFDGIHFAVGTICGQFITCDIVTVSRAKVCSKRKRIRIERIKWISDAKIMPD